MTAVEIIANNNRPNVVALSAIFFHCDKIDRIVLWIVVVAAAAAGLVGGLFLSPSRYLHLADTPFKMVCILALNNVTVR